jgi:hypothetical protein
VAVVGFSPTKRAELTRLALTASGPANATASRAPAFTANPLGGSRTHDLRLIRPSLIPLSYERGWVSSGIKPDCADLAFVSGQVHSEPRVLGSRLHVGVSVRIFPTGV